MTTQELNAKTVLELRKIAKENGVKLGAGVSKSDIVAKIAAATADSAAAPQTPAAPEPARQESIAAPAAMPVAAPASAPAAPAPSAEEKPAQPQFRQAWSNPSAAPRYNAKPAYQAPAYPQRQNGNWQQQRPANRVPAPQTDLPRMQTVRPQRYTPRFGPNAGEPVTAQPQQEEYRPQPYRTEPARPVYNAPERAGYNAPERPVYAAQERAPYQQDRSYSESSRPVYEQPGVEQTTQTTSYDNQYQRPGYAPRRENSYYQQDSAMNAAELMTAAECADGSGVLELHPDGYGFLRAETCAPTSRDIYIAQAQVRRFALRSGDFVTGKIRPQRDGDKFAAMLYITSINGMEPEAAAARPLFEELTPVYPTKRIDLDAHDGEKLDDMRLIDLIAPIGFGQRALISCPADCGKTELLQHFAQVILKNHPETHVFALLLDERPEDVTLFRDAVPGCTVAASMFGQSPENHLRVADLLYERLQRLVETGKDAVLLIDSLTKFVKICPAMTAQQRGYTPGMVVHTSLNKAKRIFSGARCMREGGSLTVIAVADVETPNPVDDSIAVDFRDAANTEIVLDRTVARAGVSPALNLQKCQTRRSEQLLSETERDGLNHVRRILGTTPSAQAIPQLLSMMDRAGSNEEFMARIADWAVQMEKTR